MRQAFDICKRVPSVSSFKSISHLRKEKRCMKLGLRSKECEWDQGFDCQVKRCIDSHPHRHCFFFASGGDILAIDTKSYHPDLGGSPDAEAVIQPRLLFRARPKSFLNEELSNLRSQKFWLNLLQFYFCSHSQPLISGQETAHFFSFHDILCSRSY